MSVTTQGTTLSRHMFHVRSMGQREVPFERLEAYVESCTDLDEEERAVLWLYAWCGAEVRFIAETLGRTVAVDG